MSRDPDCLFCKIIEGQIPCFKVHEDEKTLAFMDINPVNPGHALVVPKFHSLDIYETPTEWLTATVVAAQMVAKAVRKTLDPHGLNLVQCNGPGAQQSVFHLHLHVLPRTEGDEAKLNWGLEPGDMGEIERLAREIRANMA